MSALSMEKFPNTAEKKSENKDEDIFEKITDHSRGFDKQISETRTCSSEKIREAWQVREWKIGDTAIKAIGVAHIPETFLEFRQEIEKAIQESDVVVNEFAPEALGFYDKTSATRLRSIRSKFNDNYNLEQLRQAYLKYEKQYNIGLFHHEIELLAAKYGKDMAIADLTMSKNAEAQLQGSYLYAYGAEQIKENEAELKKLGLYTGAAALGAAGLNSFLKELKNETTLMSRRKFLKLGIMAGAAAALGGLAPKITEAPPQTALKKQMEKEEGSEDEQMEKLRDPKLADALRQLARSGYKKIAFIYGSGHLKRVEEYLDNPEKGKKELTANRELIERNNPDAFRVYRLSPGNNQSEKFVASEKQVWKIIKK